MFKDLLVVLETTPDVEGTLPGHFNPALALARQLGARLTALYVMPSRAAAADAALLAGAGGGALAAEAQLQANLQAEQFHQHRDAVEQAVLERTEADAVDCRWCTAEGQVPELLATYARFTDLVLMQAPATLPKRERGLAPASPGDLVLNAGGPVMLLPAGNGGETIGRHVTLAWNGSCESARALRDALPLLQRAESVQVLSFDETGAGGDAPPPELDVAARLAWHGIEARWSREPADGDVGEALLEHAAAGDGGLLVMGAYGHSRLRELVFGGVTRHVVGHATLPVLLSR